MSGVVVVAEHRLGEVREITYELITAAAGLKAQGIGSVSVLAIGGDDELPASLGSAGVDDVITIASPRATFEAHVTERAVAAVVEQRRPTVVLTGHTVDGFGFAPAVAARHGLGFAPNVLSIDVADGTLRARRGVYGDRLVASLEFDRGPVLLMVRPGAYEAAAAGRDAKIDTLSADVGDPLSEHLGFRGLRDADSGGVDITKQRFLLSIGRGIGEEESVERFSNLADRMGATLCASRPLVDAGWVAPARQVGQSGRSVTPSAYLALGISGAIQHLAGIRGADVVIAVNTDPAAPIFDAADYGAVIDVHDLADALEQRL
jgi:electron transfer flavoprotein alpha subunit